MIGPEGIYDTPTDNPEGDGDFDLSTAVFGLDPRPTTLEHALWSDMEVSIDDLDGQGDNKDVLLYLTSDHDYGDISAFFYLEDALSEGETFSIVHNYDSNGQYNGVQFLVSDEDKLSRVENIDLNWQGMIPFTTKDGEYINQQNSLSMAKIIAYITKTNNLNESDIYTNNLNFAQKFQGLFQFNYPPTFEEYERLFDFLNSDDTGSTDGLNIVEDELVYGDLGIEFLNPPKQDDGVLGIDSTFFEEQDMFDICFEKWEDFSHCYYDYRTKELPPTGDNINPSYNQLLNYLQNFDPEHLNEVDDSPTNIERNKLEIR
jgi:hypothetical protein